MNISVVESVIYHSPDHHVMFLNMAVGDGMLFFSFRCCTGEFLPCCAVYLGNFYLPLCVLFFTIIKNIKSLQGLI